MSNVPVIGSVIKAVGLGGNKPPPPPTPAPPVSRNDARRGAALISPQRSTMTSNQNNLGQLELKKKTLGAGLLGG